MKKIFLVFSIFALSISAQAYVDESTDSYVDRFVPSRGVKIKESNLASRMENATKKAAYGNKDSDIQWVRKRDKSKEQEYKKYEEQNNDTEYRSYKWF